MNKFVKALAIAIALAVPMIGQYAVAGKIVKVSDVFKDRAALDKKQVSVKGKVVKVSTEIMNRNWVHIQDGSGSAAKKDNDLTVTTTKDVPAVGKVVTVTGTVAKDKDFGAGYFYPVIVENATIK